MHLDLQVMNAFCGSLTNTGTALGSSRFYIYPGNIFTPTQHLKVLLPTSSLNTSADEKMHKKSVYDGC